MNLQHVNIKIFADGDVNVDLEQIVEVFHSWVAEQSMDELLIDVLAGMLDEMGRFSRFAPKSLELHTYFGISWVRRR